MNHCAMQQGSALSACEDMRSCSRDSVVCPKPRRLGLLNDPVRSFRWHFGHQAEFCDSNEMASQHPFYGGSPPSRVANPLIQDARFGDEQLISSSALSPIPALSGQSSSPSSSARKGGCVRTNFGSKPAVRVEGFDCRDRDQRNRSIPTLA